MEAPPCACVCGSRLFLNHFLEPFLVLFGCRGLGRFWAALGALLGRSWGGLGRSWGGLGRSWVDLGVVLGRLGEVLEQLGELETMIFHWFFPE